MSWYRKALLGMVGSALAALAVAPVAFATDRFVTTTGDNATSNCTTPNPANNPTTGPCSLQRAVEMVAVGTDNVIIAQGAYMEGSDQLSISGGIHVQGTAGQPPPKIFSSAVNAVSLTFMSTAQLTNVQIEHTGTGIALEGSINATGRISQVTAHSAIGRACLMHKSTVSDTVCWSEGTDSPGVTADSGGASLTLRNVTAVASGGGTSSIGVLARSFAPASNVSIDAKNVIARGNAFDVVANNTGTGGAAVTLENSNFPNPTTVAGGTVTSNMANGNQSTPALFASAATGDFHQALGSPTIDAGNNAADLLGTLDFEGEARIQNGTIDIGADEANPPAPVVPTTPTSLTPTTAHVDPCAALRAKLKKAKSKKKKRKIRKQLRALGC